MMRSYSRPLGYISSSAGEHGKYSTELKASQLNHSSNAEEESNLQPETEIYHNYVHVRATICEIVRWNQLKVVYAMAHI